MTGLTFVLLIRHGDPLERMMGTARVIAAAHQASTLDLTGRHVAH